MDKKYRTYNSIPKITRNALRARIESAVNKYGFESYRMVSNKYVKETLEKEKLQKQISEAEEKLGNLKSKAKNR